MQPGVMEADGVLECWSVGVLECCRLSELRPADADWDVHPEGARPPLVMRRMKVPID